MFGVNLHKMMQAQKISGKELSQITGISQSTISKFLSGDQEPRYSQIISIAEAFQIPPDILMLKSNHHPSINPPFINEHCMVREIYNDIDSHLHITNLYAFKEFTIEMPAIDDKALFIVVVLEGSTDSNLGKIHAGDFRIIKGTEYNGYKVTVHKGTKSILYIMHETAEEFIKNWSKMFFEHIVQQNEIFPE